MGAQIWSFFIAFLSTFVSLKGVHASPLNGQNVTEFGSGKVVINVNMYRDSEVKTAFSEMRKKLESLEGRVDVLEKFLPVPKACKFDFEDGIDGWEKTGTAFNNQPTYGDNPTNRGSSSPAGQQGDWWIGTHEDRPSKTSPVGVQRDRPQGTLTSPFFTIRGKSISFLIGGRCDIKTVRAELIIGNKVVHKDTGTCTETMTRKTWDVGAFIGQRARVKLVDSSSGGWGHINFDDMRGDISCE